MYIDAQGKNWFKGNLHTHTTVSDGRRSPEEVIQLYRDNDYDFLALTDHWKPSAGEMRDGLLLLSGCEYDFGTHVREGIYHIVAIGMTEDPGVTRANTPKEAVEAIHRVGGLAILAHPAWSLNTPEQIRTLPDIDATEIYNSVSGLPRNCRPYSGAIVDMMAAEGMCLPLVASDDTHFYIPEDTCRSYIWVQAEACTKEAILAAIRRGDFYASQGPQMEVRMEDRVVHVRTTPAVSVVLFTDTVWENERAKVGENITEACIPLSPRTKVARIEVTDAQGNTAWSNLFLSV